MTKEQRQEARQRLKERLHRYTKLKEEQRQLQEQLARVSLEATSVSSPNMDGMPRGSGISKPTEVGALALLNLTERYHEQLEVLAEEQLALERMIEDLEPDERMLMRYRYLDGMTWESVCVAMCYSWRGIHNVHARTLDKLIDLGV